MVVDCRLVSISKLDILDDLLLNILSRDITKKSCNFPMSNESSRKIKILNRYIINLLKVDISTSKVDL